MKLKTFLDELGSASPTPGGGAAAALTGALGLSLVEMTARINAKRKPEAAAKSRIRDAVKYRARLLALMGLDAEAFRRLTRFTKETRGTAAYQAALRHASRVPLEMCLLSEKAMTLAYAEVKRVSPWLASDLVEAALLTESAFYAARLNVEINLKYLKDAAFSARTRSRLARAEKRVRSLGRAVASELRK